jgi:TPR repeat protein/serine/threonine protein kinase
VVVVCPNPDCRKSLSISSERPTGPRRCPFCGTTFHVKGSTEQPLKRDQRSPAVDMPTSKNAVPAMIGPYQVSGELGRGAFGVVYHGFDAALKREVAIKVLNRSAIGSATAVERFLREAQVVAGMHHNHIVPVYQLGEHEGGFYIASRFIRGTTLADIIPDRGMAVARAVELMLQLLDALAYANEQGVVHRDVKPDNALLDEKGNLHLTDFGLAGWVDGAQLTQEGTVLGTPCYMAPEQAQGNLWETSAAADQYSAGVVLYEMLTGHPPFEAGPLSILIHNVIHTLPPPLTVYRADLSPPLQAICLKALAKRPEDRFADCRTMAAALREWLAAPHIPPIPTPALPAEEPVPELLPVKEPRSRRRPSTGEHAGRRTHSSVAKETNEEISAATRPGGSPAQPSQPRTRSREEVPTPTAPESSPRTVLEGRWLWGAALGAAVALLFLTAGLVALVALLNRGARVAMTERDETIAPQPMAPSVKKDPFVPAKEAEKPAEVRAEVIPPKEEPPSAKKDPFVPPKEAEKHAEVRADIEACMTLIRSSVSSNAYVREKAPARIAVWRRAAEQGSAEGQWLLAKCLELGAGTAKNEEEAVRWYRKAADQGNAMAQHNLGVMYTNGRGVMKDDKEAVKWLRKAADQGLAWGQNSLGQMYANGLGVDRDDKEAVKWYRKAADQGLALAQHNLGAMYANGRGVVKDDKEAVKWLRKAADQGLAWGQNSLGVMYENGRGVDKDVTEAIRWYLKAADLGQVPA